MNSTGLCVRLMDRDLTNNLKEVAKRNSRSVGKQIEYWARIGRIGTQNPELTGNEILKIMEKE